MGEFLQLLWLNLVVKKRNLVEFVRVVWRYYRSWRFLRIDTSLIFSYLFCSPFKISKNFLLKRREEDIYAYGETPLTTMDFIAKECQINAEDVFYELGSGRGRTCFWMRHFIQCHVVGIEYIPTFVQQALKIQQHFEMSQLEFRLKDMRKDDYADATVVYLYGTCLDEKFIRKLIKKFKQLPPETKYITVSYPLTDYSPDFIIEKQFEAAFTWGKTTVYLTKRNT